MDPSGEIAWIPLIVGGLTFAKEILFDADTAGDHRATRDGKAGQRPAL